MDLILILMRLEMEIYTLEMVQKTVFSPELMVRLYYIIMTTINLKQHHWCSVTGNLNLGDDNSLYFGAGDDLEIKHIANSFNNIQGFPRIKIIQSASRIQLKESLHTKEWYLLIS